MKEQFMQRQCFLSKLVFILSTLLLPVIATAQFSPPTLGEGPWIFSTFEQERVRLSVITRGVDNPYGMLFVPGSQDNASDLGDILFTERRTGLVRLYRDGQLQDVPVGDLNSVFDVQQLFDVNAHPRFEENGLLYFTWLKNGTNPNNPDGLWFTTAVASGRWDGNRVVDLKEVFEADAWADHPGGASTRGQFLPDGTFIFGVSHRIDRDAPQSLDTHIGKVLRINDDGTAPVDNPYYAVEGALPEIFTWGNRSVMDFTIHPQTGEIWELENGPQGGDEVNILRPGANYGWPLATFGRDYDGTRLNNRPWIEGTELPEVFWVPSITVAGMTFYTGDAFPKWQNNLFVTSMIQGRINGTGHLERVAFNENGEMRRESLFRELGQRIRYVSQGPDGLLYLLTDHVDGVLLRLEPAQPDAQVQAIQRQQLSDAGIDAPEIFSESDCLVCHRVENRVVGPSFREIAQRYSASDDVINQLVESIITGGEGVWGDVPMTSHPDLARESARQMVIEILRLE